MKMMFTELIGRDKMEIGDKVKIDVDDETVYSISLEAFEEAYPDLIGIIVDIDRDVIEVEGENGECWYFVDDELTVIE